MQPATARLKGSCGASSLEGGFWFELKAAPLRLGACDNRQPHPEELAKQASKDGQVTHPSRRPLHGLLRMRAVPSPPSAQCDVDGAFRQIMAEATLIELRDQIALQLIAFVKERQPEGKADVVENLGILGPGDHRAWAHHCRQIAGCKSAARQIGDA